MVLHDACAVGGRGKRWGETRLGDNRSPFAVLNLRPPLAPRLSLQPRDQGATGNLPPANSHGVLA